MKVVDAPPSLYLTWVTAVVDEPWRIPFQVAVALTQGSTMVRVMVCLLSSLVTGMAILAEVLAVTVMV